MSHWYYADAARQRHGPLSSAALLELLQGGQLHHDTLVWREGLPAWAPLRSFAEELGLPAAAAPLPPPLPPPAVAPAAVATAAAPKSGLSGCAIGGIIAAAVGVVGLAVIGVLAAIAVPAYQEYTLRAKSTAAIAQMEALKPQIEAYIAAQQRCPVNGDDGFGTPESYADAQIAQVRVGRFDNGHCGLEATLREPGRDALDGKALWLDYDEQSAAWTCSAEVDDRYLPVHCRG